MFTVAMTSVLRASMLAVRWCTVGHLRLEALTKKASVMMTIWLWCIALLCSAPLVFEHQLSIHFPILDCHLLSPGVSEIDPHCRMEFSFDMNV